MKQITTKQKKSLSKTYKEVLSRAVQISRKNIAGFVKFTKRDYDFQWYQLEICRYLDKLESGEIKKLMIFIPPQHGKSELSSRRLPSYILGRNPKAKIVVASYSASLSSSFNRDCQKIMEDKTYRILFPETKLNTTGSRDTSGELRNNNIFETVGYKGFLKTVGVRGSLTGATVDYGIVDDPFKDRAEANSKIIRDKVWEWYQDVFLTRLHNDSRQLLLFTRWHEDDIAGRILNPKSKYYNKEEAEEWTVIAIPGLKEETKPLKQAIEINDPRKIGDALWEKRHSKKRLNRIKKINPPGFNSLYQQRPTAQEGNKIKREWFIIRGKNELPFNINNISPDYFIDGAFTDKTQNDETAIGSFYFNKADGNLYVINAIGMRKELYELLKFIKPYVKKNYYKPTSSIFIELKASGHPIKSMLRKVEYGGFNARGINNKVVALGKYNRVENSEPFLASGRVILVKGEWNNTFIEQCVAFPNDAHDDLVDILTYAIHKYLIKKSGGGVSYE